MPITKRSLYLEKLAKVKALADKLAAHTVHDHSTVTFAEIGFVSAACSELIELAACT